MVKLYPTYELAYTLSQTVDLQTRKRFSEKPMRTQI